MTCELCKRKLKTTKHHLIPRETHNKKWCKKMFDSEERNNRKIDVCHDCHLAIHKFMTNKELAQEFNTTEKLLENNKLKNFVNWVSISDNRKFKT
jgi:hypothetical protein